MTNKKIFIHDLAACSMRSQNIQKYKDFFERSGHVLVDKMEDSDSILVWTCGYREDVMSNSLSELNLLKMNFSKSEIIAGGCIPDIDRDRVNREFGGKILNWKEDESLIKEYYGTDDSINLVDFVYSEDRKTIDLDNFRKENPDEHITFNGQFINIVISEGCNYACSYCSEILMFPDFKSFSLEGIVEQAKMRIGEKNGYNLMLSADSLGEWGKTGKSYGSDKQILPDLIESLCDIDERVTVSLHNLHPHTVLRYFDRYLDLIEKNKIFHMNLPIQSTSNRILKLMNRIYKKEDLIKLFGTLKEMGFTNYDTHIIVGFPTEQEKDIFDTVNFIVEYNLNYVLVSRYMEVLSAPSAKINDKILKKDIDSRVKIVEDIFTKNNIIYNTNESDLMREQIRRLNL